MNQIIKQGEDTLIDVTVVEGASIVDFSTALILSAELKSGTAIVDTFNVAPTGEESLMTLFSATTLRLHAIDENTATYPVGPLTCKVIAHFPAVGDFPDDDRKETYKVVVGKVIQAD
jgi:hypothetical protein